LIHAKDPNEGGAFVLKIGRGYHYINSNDIACGHAQSGYTNANKTGRHPF
jgi:hypothetical protein